MGVESPGTGRMERVGGGYAEVPPTPAELVRMLQADSEEHQSMCAQLEAERDACRWEIEQLLERSAHSASEIRRLQALVDARQEKDEVCAELRAELGSMASALQHSLEELSELRRGLKGRDEAIDSAARRNAQLQEELGEVRRGLEERDEEVESLTRRIAQLEEELGEVRRGLDGRDEVVESLTRRNAQLQEELAQFRRELKSREGVVDSLTWKNEQLQVALADAKREIAGCEQRNLVLELHEQEMSSEKEKEQHAWEREREQLRAQVRSALEEVARGHARVEAAEAAAQEARREAGKARAAEELALTHLGHEKRERLSAAEWEGAFKEAHDTWATEREQLVSEAQAARVELREQAVRVVEKVTAQLQEARKAQRQSNDERAEWAAERARASAALEHVRAESTRTQARLELEVRKARLELQRAESDAAAAHEAAQVSRCDAEAAARSAREAEEAQRVAERRVENVLAQSEEQLRKSRTEADEAAAREKCALQLACDAAHDEVAATRRQLSSLEAHLAAVAQRADAAEQRATQAVESGAREVAHCRQERDAMQVELERLRRAMKRDGQAALMQQEQQAEELHTRLATCEQQKGAALRESVQQTEKARRAEEEATRLAEALRLAEEKAAHTALVSHKSAESVEAMRAELQELRGELDRSVAQGVSTKNTMETHGRAVPKLVDVQAVRHAAEEAADCIHAEAHRAFEARVRMLEQVTRAEIAHTRRRFNECQFPQSSSCHASAYHHEVVQGTNSPLQSVGNRNARTPLAHQRLRRANNFIADAIPPTRENSQATSPWPCCPPLEYAHLSDFNEAARSSAGGFSPGAHFHLGPRTIN